MEKNSTTRHVAIVEKCVMTEMAWRYIFSREDNSQYRIHFFKNINLLRGGGSVFPMVSNDLFTFRESFVQSREPAFSSRDGEDSTGSPNDYSG